MTRRPQALAALTIAAFVAASAHAYGQQAATPADHSAHHPEAAAQAPAAPGAAGMMASMKMMESMKASNAKLDALVTKMNAATGAAKTDAIAELLTALVSERHSCEAMMADKMKAK